MRLDDCQPRKGVHEIPPCQTGCLDLYCFHLIPLRAWFSGRTSPCQGEGHEFESRRPLRKARTQRTGACLFSEGKIATVYAKTEREVRAKLRELQREADRGGSLPVSGPHTVNELLDAWLENAPNLKFSTIIKNR